MAECKTNVSKSKGKRQEKEQRQRKNAAADNKVYSNIEQWVLVKNMEKLDKYYHDLARPAADGGEDEFKYYTFRQVNGNGAQLVNKLRGIDNLNVFYKIKTSTLSLLQPKLRLYKVTYEDFKYAADGSVDQSSVHRLGQPCYREFKFSDNFGIETAASVQEYLKYETTKPSFRNVGIESFTMTQQGETHGAIENNIECQLALTFKSIKDLNASPPGDPSLRYVDLILWPPARYTDNEERYNPSHYEIKAIIGYTAPSKQQLRALNLDESEVKAIRDIEKLNQIISLGMYDYNISIQENGSVKLKVSFRGRLETAIGTNQVNIFQDNIRLTTDGNLELSQDKKSKTTISHYSKLASDVNTIFMGLKESGCLADCKEKDLLDSLTKNDKFFGSILTKTINQYSAGRPSWSDYGLKKVGETFEIKNDTLYYTWFKNKTNVKRLLAAMKKEVGDFKNQIFMSFVDQLIAGDGKKSPRTRVFCALPETTEMETYVTAVDLAGIDGDTGAGGLGMAAADEGITVDQQQAQVRVDNMTNAIRDDKISFSFGRCEDVAKNLRALSEQMQDMASPSSGVPAANAAAEGGDAAVEEEKAPAHAWSTDKSGEYKFYFIYLGDIIELACKNAGMAALKFPNSDITKDAIFPWSRYVGTNEEGKIDENPLVNARVLLGPLEYIGEDTRIKKTNLASMPISFRNFRAWFMRKVMSRRRTQMSLGSFLSSLINDLVVPSLTRLPEKRLPSNARANIISLTLPGKIKQGDSTQTVCGDGTISPTEEALPMTRVLDVEGPVFERDYMRLVREPRSSETMIKTSFDYLLIYVTTHLDIINRQGDPTVDIEDGIYHFSIGSDQGLLKNVDFSRVPIPGFAEMRSEQSERPLVVGDPANIEQLKFPHNSNVFLVGTSLFTPGMYFYVNPSLAGLGSVESAASIAYQLNLGGYHMISEVSTEISPGKYVTKLVGVQQ